MVGRESEVAVVAEFLSAARPLGPRALVLEGVPGIGKTTIVRDALLRASATGVRALVARPAAGEQELPFSALGDLLGSLPDDAFASLPLPQQSAIFIATPPRTRARRRPKCKRLIGVDLRDAD